MINVSSTVHFNTVLLSRLTKASVEALKQTAEALHTEVVQSQVFPRDTGTLQNTSTFVDYSQANQGTVTIVSSTPYARRLYFHPEYHFKTTANPNAKGRWYEDWLPGGSKAGDITEMYAENYRRLIDL